MQRRHRGNSLTSLTPARNALNVSSNITISVAFTKSVNTSTLTNSTIKINGYGWTAHDYSYSYNSSTQTVTITPATPFKVGEIVTTTLTLNIKDEAGDSLASASSWSFTIKSNGGSGTFTQSSKPPVGNAEIRSRQEISIAMDILIWQ